MFCDFVLFLDFNCGYVVASGLDVLVPGHAASGHGVLGLTVGLGYAEGAAEKNLSSNLLIRGLACRKVYVVYLYAVSTDLLWVLQLGSEMTIRRSWNVSVPGPRSLPVQR